MAKDKLGRAIDQAARARTDLTIFHGIVALLEGGTVSADSYPDSNQIIEICKNASARCLSRMDKAVADAKRAAKSPPQGAEE